MNRVFCNICIDDSDLDNILSKLSTLKTKIADWVQYKKDQGILKDGVSGLNTNICASLCLANINMTYNVGSLNGTEEDFQNAINLISDVLSEIG